MSALEYELVEKISHFTTEQQRKVLDYVQTLETPAQAIHSTQEILKLSPEERERLVKFAFELATNDDFEIFEA